MKNFLKYLISLIPVSFIESALALSIISNIFEDVRRVKLYNTRESMWHDVANFFDSEQITFFEFGVWRGYSIRYFSELNSNKSSLFVGFDSFEGLPEDWGTERKGSFNEDGIIPEVDDERVKLVKGWFQNTLPDFIESNRDKISKHLIVHYDADLYSSTLFCLNMVDKLKIEYIAVFDQFYGHETRALYNYIQMSGAKVEFLGRTGNQRHWPLQVMCRIRPTKELVVN